MAQSLETEERIRTAISLEICPIKMSSATDKSYKERITKEINKTINALLNSGGGTLEMIYKSIPARKQVDACVRIIEQKIGDSIGTVGLVSNIEIEVLSQKILIHVKDVEGLFVVNYNLYLPTKSQVKVIEPSESLAKVKAAINRGKPVKEVLSPGACYQDFVMGERVTCDENTNTQWKSLKSKPSKNITLADRITGKANKLSCYISAFANHSGGHIYYGINDDGIVEGELVTEKDQTEITSKITKTVERIIWPRHCSGVQQKGRHWDIFFISVKDGEGKPIPSTFVIVVAIAYCRGGVFTDEPECYHISDGRVERTKMADLQKYFGETSETPPEPIPPKIQLATWSSKKNRHIYEVLTTKLVQLRNNDGKIEEFNKLCDLAMRKYPNSCASLVSTAQKAAIACKNNQFKTAKCLLGDFFEVLNQPVVNDVLFFKVRALYLKSRIERAEGKCEESYETAKDCLQMMQFVQADFLTVLGYIQAAAVAIILSSKERDSQKYNTLVEESQTYFQAALRDANTLDEHQFLTSDLKQKTRIYLAMSQLGCSLTGEIAKRKILTKVDIDNAASELKAVQGSMFDGIQPTRFQEVEYFLAQSDLCYCRSTLSDLAKQTNDLKWAFELSKKAQCLAQELQFEEAVLYANRRLNRLTEMLNRNALMQSPSNRRLEKDLEDLLDFPEERNRAAKRFKSSCYA